ncbi:MAG TPA: hypothetical protein VGW57_16705 [Chthoniobacterales bacterium]|nr:hypothetical protein [Chthoniobacterales bacterium]
MAEDIQIEILSPEQVFGTAAFSLTVRITNLTSEELAGVSVEPVTLPGKLVQIGADDEDTEVSELQLTKRRLVQELEKQVRRAYERDRFNRMSFTEKILFGFVELMDAYTSFFTLGRSQGTKLVPSWATEALRIQDWEDVERLEREVISAEKDGSFLKKMFLINKDKLERCFSQLHEADKSGRSNESLILGDSLLPASSCSYPFTIKAPHALRSKQGDAQFRVTFRKGGEQRVFQRSVGKNITLLASAFAVPTGSMLGAACGYAIRSTVKMTAVAASQTASTTGFSWQHLAGSMLLGLILALLTSRKPETKKPITVEDFVGGFLIGAAAGLFSEEALKRIGALFQ